MSHCNFAEAEITAATFLSVPPKTPKWVLQGSESTNDFATDINNIVFAQK